TDQWLRHPARDVTMAEGCTNQSIDNANGACDATLGRWFNTAVVLSWVPVVSQTCGVACTPGGGAAIPGTEAASDNEPFCGTCHKAHGSNRDAGVIWDDPTTAAYEDGSTSTMTNLCQNCHYK
ncbi:MAG: cytochrome c3 family protein, partial [bacterium]